jgi:fermentation-respiration switch protein FrsA (DUF1100 family)
MDRPVDMDPAQIAASAPVALDALDKAGSGMLDGTLEFMDEWVINQLKEALWSVSQGDFPIAQTLVDDPKLEDMVDHELQDFAAALFTAAAGQPKGFHGMLGALGSQRAENIVLLIESWEQDREPEEDLPEI